MVSSSKKRRSRSHLSAKRQKQDEASSDSFVVTEELSQTSCGESVSDESYESDSSLSDDDFSDDETADSVVQGRINGSRGPWHIISAGPLDPPPPREFRFP